MVTSTTPSGGPEMRLNIKYNGPAVDRGRMNAIELGPAIFGFGKVVSQTSRILYGDETRVTLEVRADFERASFGIEFYAVSSIGDLVPSLTLEQLAAIASMLGVSGFGGVIGIIKWLKGRKVDGAEREGDRVTIITQDDSLTINYNEYRLLADPEVRRGLRAVVTPIASEGVESVEFQTEDEPPKKIGKDERQYFEAYSLPEEELTVDRSTPLLEVIGPVFRPGNRWRFGQGEATFHAEISDEEFLRRVDRHELVFGQGDALQVEMETEATREGGELKYRRRITKVLQHIPADRGPQLRLPVDD